MKFFLITKMTVLSVIIPTLSFAQIQQVNVAKPKVAIEKKLMDSTKVRQHLSDVKYLKGEYCYFMTIDSTHRGKPVWVYKYDCYTPNYTCELTPNEIKQLYGARFIVDSIHDKTTEYTRLLCEVVDSIGNRTGMKFMYYYRYINSYSYNYSYPDQILPERTYNFLVQKYVNKRFYTREGFVHSYDMITGEKIEDLNKQKWTCIGISCIEDGTFVFLLKSEMGYTSYTEIEYLDRGFADTKKQYIFSNDEWNELGKKYGFSNLRKALNYEFWTGMPSGLLSLGMGTPDDFTYTSEHDIYIYGDLYIFVEDQRVVGWY